MCLYDPIFKVSSVLHCVPLVRCNCQAKLKWKQVSDAAKHLKTNGLFSAFSFLVLILYLTLASVMYQIMITWSVQYFLCCTSRCLLSAAVVLIISSREQDKSLNMFICQGMMYSQSPSLALSFAFLLQASVKHAQNSG